MTIHTTPAAGGTRTGAVMSNRHIIPLLAAQMTMAALAIDTLLPSLPDIAKHLKMSTDDPKIGWLITAFMLGTGLGQAVMGPLSDSFGRRKVCGVSLVAYCAFAIGATFAPSFPLMLLARLGWGLAASGPRTTSIAMARDMFEGSRMAQVLSYVMAVFMIVPVLAPAIGTGILHVGGWRLVMAFPGLIAVVVTIATWRSPETLDPANRRAFSAGAIRSGFGEVLHIRATVAFMLTGACMAGFMSTYLSLIEPIVRGTYHREGQFALIFGGIAVAMSAANFTSARFVRRVGMRRVLTILGPVTASVAFVLAVLSIAWKGSLPFAVFVIGMAAILGCQMVLLPSVNTCAMVPVGHLAGVAAGVIGTVSTILGAVIGIGIAALQRSGTTLLCVTAFVLFATTSVLIRTGLRSSTVD